MSDADMDAFSRIMELKARLTDLSDGSKEDEINKIINNIEFRFIDENTLLPNNDVSVDIAGCAHSLCEVNTYIHDSGARFLKCPELLKVPRFSTVANAYIISELVRRMPAGAAYLNIGVWYGFTFLTQLIDNPDKVCIGVDNFSQFGGPRDIFLAYYDAVQTELSRFHDMDYLHYFDSVHKEPLGVYFYDGEHSYGNQLKALEVAEPFYASGTYIVVDDTNDPEPYQATMDFISARPGRYRILLDKKTPQNSHPTYWNGLMVLQKV